MAHPANVPIELSGIRLSLGSLGHHHYAAAEFLCKSGGQKCGGNVESLPDTGGTACLVAYLFAEVKNLLDIWTTLAQAGMYIPR
jgi:hypothetical protein